MEAAHTNRSVPARQASKMLYLLCNLGLVFTAIITSAFITIVTGKLRMLRIIAFAVKTIFSTWYSYFHTISFMGHYNQRYRFRLSYVLGDFIRGCLDCGTKHMFFFEKFLTRPPRLNTKLIRTKTMNTTQCSFRYHVIKQYSTQGIK